MPFLSIREAPPCASDRLVRIITNHSFGTCLQHILNCTLGL